MKRKLPLVSDKTGRQIRLNRVTLTPHPGEEYADVLFLGDVHYGSPQFDEPRFLSMLDYCLRNEMYLLLMGDLLETGTKASVGAGVYEQEDNTSGQYDQMCDWLQPLADKGLILGSHIGNHCERIYKDSGFNVMKALCRQLKVKYLGTACWSELKVGSQSYHVYSLHGATGSRFDGTALLAVERISTSFMCDLIAMGHTHKLVTSSVIIQRIVNNMVKEFKKYLLLTGSFLKYDGGYAQTVGLPLSKLGSPRVRFYATRHDLYISW